MRGSAAAPSSSTRVNISSNWSITSTSSVPSSAQDSLHRRGGGRARHPRAARQTRPRRHSAQRRLELLERIGAREHLDDGQPRSPATLPRAERHQAGADHRRLAAAARADDGEEADRAAARQALDQRLAPEEVGRVGLLEGAQRPCRDLAASKASTGVGLAEGTERSSDRLDTLKSCSTPGLTSHHVLSCWSDLPSRIGPRSTYLITVELALADAPTPRLTRILSPVWRGWIIRAATLRAPPR